MDARLFRAVNRLADRTSWAHGVARTYAKDGIVLFAVLLVVGWYLARRDDDLTAAAGTISSALAALAALGLGQIIGHVVERARPYTAMPATQVLVARTADFSFPSDHATAVGAVAVGLLLVRRQLGWVACALAVAMAFIRVYAGAHYPGDVVAGLALGAAVALVLRPLAVRLLVPLLEWTATTPLRPLVAPARGDS